LNGSILGLATFLLTYRFEAESHIYGKSEALREAGAGPLEIVCEGTKRISDNISCRGKTSVDSTTGQVTDNVLGKL